MKTTLGLIDTDASQTGLVDMKRNFADPSINIRKRTNPQ